MQHPKKFTLCYNYKTKVKFKKIHTAVVCLRSEENIFLLMLILAFEKLLDYSYISIQLVIHVIYYNIFPFLAHCEKIHRAFCNPISQ